MSLTYAKMSEDVWLTCLTHALSTETEEIMGLLLGDIVYSKDGSIVALIWGASPQSRSDRRKDRVETTPEQLAAASAQAERMTISTGRTTRVIGWYHSHPHITVLPSHVDVRTQAMYQLLDSGFIGLIFSCFSEDVNKVGRIQVIAFQSSDGNRNSTNNSLTVFRKSKDQVIDIESSRSSSESMSYGKSYSAMAEHPEQDTGDSRGSSGSKGGGRAMDFGAYFVNNTANTTGRDGNSDTNNLNNAIVEIDPIDMSEGMQEAMLRSNMDVSGAEYVRKEIPLHVLPASSLFQLDYPLSSYTDLQHVLFDEERAAYQQAVLQTMRDGRVHPLLFIHHTSTYQASMCKLIEHCLSPAISALQDRLRENEIRLERLKDEAKTLEVEALSRSDSRGESPRHVSGSGSRSKRGF